MIARRDTAAIVRVVCDLYRDGMPRDRIALVMDLTPRRVARMLKAGGYEPPKWPAMVTRVLRDGRAFVVQT